MLATDGEFHELDRGLRSNRQFAEFLPLAAFIDPQY